MSYNFVCSRFIGELFKKNMCTPKIMVDCIVDLVNKNVKHLECLSNLLEAVGEKLEKVWQYAFRIFLFCVIYCIQNFNVDKIFSHMI